MNATGNTDDNFVTWKKGAALLSVVPVYMPKKYSFIWFFVWRIKVVNWLPMFCHLNLEKNFKITDLYSEINRCKDSYSVF